MPLELGRERARHLPKAAPPEQSSAVRPYACLVSLKKASLDSSAGGGSPDQKRAQTENMREVKRTHLEWDPRAEEWERRTRNPAPRTRRCGRSRSATSSRPWRGRRGPRGAARSDSFADLENESAQYINQAPLAQSSSTIKIIPLLPAT